MNLELYTRGNFRNRVQCYQYHLSWTMMLVGEPQSGAEKKKEDCTAALPKTLTPSPAAVGRL